MKYYKITDTVVLIECVYPIGYEEIVTKSRQNNIDVLIGRLLILETFQENQEFFKLLPRDGKYIAGLDLKDNLPKGVYSCGTVLYYFPILYFISIGVHAGFHLGESCMSGSGLIDNFDNCYLLGKTFSF